MKKDLMKKTKRMLEVFVGLLAIVLSLIALYPFSLNNSIAGELFVFGVFINALLLLGVGVLRLHTAFSFEDLSSIKKINVVTYIVMIATAVAVLFFEVVSAEHFLLHFLFGIGLLSYAVGRIFFGMLTRKNKSILRAFHLVIGFAVAVLSDNVLSWFPVQFPFSTLSFEYFVRIALVLIGFDCLISAILGNFLLNQKPELTNPTIGHV